MSLEPVDFCVEIHTNFRYQFENLQQKTQQANVSDELMTFFERQLTTYFEQTIIWKKQTIINATICD